jgi:hypothetical protein
MAWGFAKNRALLGAYGLGYGSDVALCISHLAPVGVQNANLRLMLVKPDVSVFSLVIASWQAVSVANAALSGLPPLLVPR